MTELPREPGPTPAPEPVSSADQRMADLLSSRSQSSDVRRQLREESTAEASDLLGRLNALDFVDTVIGADRTRIIESVKKAAT